MRHVRVNRLFVCYVVVSPVCVVVTSSCARQETVRAANRTLAKPDPLLGKWIMLADNGGGGSGIVADFRSDGTVRVTQDGKTTVLRYRRESGSAWVHRRVTALRLKKYGESAQFRKPGVEMIEFAGPNGTYLDYGGTLLTLDPQRRVLYNILTQLWCRPGEEGTARAQLRLK